MFGPVRPTEMDLQFNLLGIPVRVLPWFWLVAVILGYQAIHRGWQYLLGWVVVVFFSILVHELGHALVARLFGYSPHIALYHFGGLAMFTPGRDFTAGKSILITLAGPGAGLALWGMTEAVVFGLGEAGIRPTDLASFTIRQLVWVNFWWSFINLLPVYPLDGGQISREVCTSLRPARGEVWMLWISIMTAGCVAVWAFAALDDRYIGFMFAFMGLQNYQMMQMRRHWR